MLPYWLANPDIAELDLLSEEVPVDDMEVKSYFIVNWVTKTALKKHCSGGLNMFHVCKMSSSLRSVIVT